MENINWQYECISTEGTPLEIDGVNVWEAKWVKSNLKSFSASHPSYPRQNHEMLPYKIEENGKSINIAVGEVSPNVYVFYKLTRNT